MLTPRPISWIKSLPLQPYLDHQTKQQDDMNYTILILIYGGQDDTDIMMTWPLQCDY